MVDGMGAESVKGGSEEVRILDGRMAGSGNYYLLIISFLENLHFSACAIEPLRGRFRRFSVPAQVPVFPSVPVHSSHPSERGMVENFKLHVLHAWIAKHTKTAHPRA